MKPNDFAELMELRIKVATELAPELMQGPFEFSMLRDKELTDSLFKVAENETWADTWNSVKSRIAGGWENLSNAWRGLVTVGKNKEDFTNAAKNVNTLGQLFSGKGLQSMVKSPWFALLIGLVMTAILGRKNPTMGLLGGLGAGLATHAIANPGKWQNWWGQLQQGWGSAQPKAPAPGTSNAGRPAAGGAAAANATLSPAEQKFRSYMDTIYATAQKYKGKFTPAYYQGVVQSANNFAAKNKLSPDITKRVLSDYTPKFQALMPTPGAGMGVQ